jgi:hypothetical protein
MKTPASILLIVISLISLDYHARMPAPPQLPASPSSLTYSWTRTWGGSNGNETATNVAVDQLGDIYVTGVFTGTVNFDPGAGTTQGFSHGAQDVYLTKFDSSGNFVWVRTWGGSGEDISYRPIVDGLSRMLVFGSFANTVDFNPAGGDSHDSKGQMDAFLIQFPFAPLNNHVYLPTVNR